MDAADDQPFLGAAWAADKRLLIVRRGHGSTMLAFPDEGPRVLATVGGSSPTRSGA